MAEDNVVRRPVTSSTDVAQRMGELVQRADASKSVVEEAATSLVSEVDKMTKQIGVFQDYIEEIRDLGGSVGIDGNGTGAAMVLETPELTKAVEEQTDAARETRETFASLQEKIDKEQAERTKKVDEFIRALDDDRRQMAEDMRARDDEFMDKLYSNVVRQGSASAQQSSFDRLVESYEGPSTADRVMQGAGTAAEVAQGMDTGQAYAAAIQQTVGYAAQTKGGDVEALIGAVMSGDRDKFNSVVGELKNASGLGIDGMAKQISVQQQLASLFGMKQLPMSLIEDPDGVFDMLSDVLVGGANRAQQESVGGDGVNSMLERAKELGGSTEASSINTYSEAGIIEVSGMSNYVSGLSMGDKKGDAVLKDILSKDYASLSDDEKAIFMQAMELSGEVTAEDMAGMTDEGMARMFSDTAWSYGEYGKDWLGNQTGAASFLSGKFDWQDKGAWYGYSDSDTGETPVALTVRWQDDAEKVLAIMVENGREQMQSDNGGM